jgi:biotin carboxylase
MTYANKSRDIRGVICTATDCPDTQAAVAERLNLPTIVSEAAKAGRDKWVQIEKLASAGLPVPESKHLDVRATWADLEGFDIIKPVASRGARGVQRLSKDNFNRQIFIALSESMPNYKRLVAQKFVEGVQLSTESIVYDGKVVFSCFALRNYEYLSRFSPFIIENGCDTPYFISADQLSAYNDLILKSADALHWNNWTIKGDLVLQPNGQWTIIELAPRLSGGLLSSNIIPEVYGYDYVSSYARMATGNTPLEYEYANPRYACQRYLFPEEDWAGKTLSALPPASNGVRYYKELGNRIDKVTSHANRLGQVITVANSATSARERAEKIINDTLSQIRVG